jgi:DNA polymerase-3 subunit theta
MSFNLANKSKDEMDKLYVDKEAAGVAFKERYNQPVIAEQVAAIQPSHLQDYFFERLKVHREYSKTLGRLEPQHDDRK